MTRGFFSHFLLRISWIIVFKWNNNAIRPLRELETTETLRDPINCAFYWKGTRNGSRLTDWQVPFCRVSKWPSIISGASSSLYFTVGESVVALYSSLYYQIPSFLRDFDGILNEWKLYLNLIKQRKSAVQLQVNDTHFVFRFFLFFSFYDFVIVSGVVYFLILRRLDKNGANRPNASDFVFLQFSKCIRPLTGPSVIRKVTTGCFSASALSSSCCCLLFVFYPWTFSSFGPE